MHVVAFKFFFGMKRAYVYVWWTCEKVWVLRVCFLKSKRMQANKRKKCPRLLVCDSFLYILLVCGGFSYGLLVGNSFLYILLVCSDFFVHIVSMRWFFIHTVSFKIIFYMKRGDV